MYFVISKESNFLIDNKSIPGKRLKVKKNDFICTYIIKNRRCENIPLCIYLGKRKILFKFTHFEYIYTLNLYLYKQRHDFVTEFTHTWKLIKVQYNLFILQYVRKLCCSRCHHYTQFKSEWVSEPHPLRLILATIIS